MKKTVIGENAGLVWRTLDSQDKKMSFDELQEATKLNDIDLAAAIGWLAREDKISIRENDGEFYISNYQETYF